MFHSTVGAAFWTALPAEIANHDCTASRAPVALKSKVADRVCRRSFQRRPKPDNWFPFPLVRQILRSILTPPEHTGAPLCRMAPADAGRGIAFDSKTNHIFTMSQERGSAPPPSLGGGRGPQGTVVPGSFTILMIGK